MNVFERHFAMLKRGQDVFEQYKRAENIGIRISDKKKKDYVKIGGELLTKEKGKQFMEVRSIHYHNVVVKKLEEYSLPEWLVCLNEEVLLEYAIPIFSRVLNKYPMLCGMNNEWQVLYDITKINPKFWEDNREWKMYFVEIIEKIFWEYEQNTSVIFIPEEYLYQFSIFKNP